MDPVCPYGCPSESRRYSTSLPHGDYAIIAIFQQLLPISSKSTPTHTSGSFTRQCGPPNSLKTYPTHKHLTNLFHSLLTLVTSTPVLTPIYHVRQVSLSSHSPVNRPRSSSNSRRFGFPSFGDICVISFVTSILPVLPHLFVEP
jgi:hypothetical protein